MPRSCLLAMAAFVAAAVPVSGQPTEVNPVVAHLEQLARESPSAFYLDHSEELDLNADQISQLEMIQLRVIRENQAGIDPQLRDMPREVPATGSAPPNRQSPGSREALTMFRELTMEMRKNLQRGRSEALAVLTESQQKRAGELQAKARR